MEPITTEHGALSPKGRFDWRNRAPGELLLVALAALCFAYALYIAVRYADQAPLDIHRFRQTQTALTAYWLGQNGFSLAYETPVAGPPWSIPFEFPLYQYIVALVSQASHVSLDASGRLVSFLFLVLCLMPASAITRSLKLSDSTFYLFAALLMSSPLYLYWGRTFMIETAAVFFSIAGIKYFVDLLQNMHPARSAVLFVLFISLGILQKATTGLPVLAVLSFVYLGALIREWRSTGTLFLARKTLLALLYFGIPLLIGIAWTLYTDQVKLLNSLGASLTSGALAKWNWGSLSQRLSVELYRDVIWQRMFERNLAGVLGFAILAVALGMRASRQTKLVIVVSALLGLLPLFLFSNLHIIHSYYQTGNMVFLIYAGSVALGHVLYLRRKLVAVVLAVAMIGSNYFWFAMEQLPVVKTDFNAMNSRDYAVGEFLRAHVPEGNYFVAFGNDWSSTFAYMAQRKSFTVPPFYKDYGRISRHPEQFIDAAHLGAVVVCPFKGPPSREDLVQWSVTGRRWKIGQVQNCYIAVPDTAPPATTGNAVAARCEGHLDMVSESQVGSHRMLQVAGWTTVSGKEGMLPEKVFVTLSKDDGLPLHFEAFRVKRPDVAAFFGQPNVADSGFARMIVTDSLDGEYVVGVARETNGRLQACQFRKSVVLGGDGANG